MYGKRKRLAAGASVVYRMLGGGKPASRPSKRVKSSKRAGIKMKYGRKRGRSYTKRSSKGSLDDTAYTHGGVDSKTIRVGNFNSAKLLRGQNSYGKWRYQQTYRYNLQTTAGLQSATNIVLPCHGFKLLSSTGAGYDFTQNDVALEALNPYFTATNNYAFVGSPVTPLNDRFIVNTCNLQLEFTNFAATGVYIDVYVVQYKKNTTQDPLQIWASGLASQALGAPLSGQPTAKPAGTANSAGVLGYPQLANVHVQPRESKLFMDWFQIHKVKRLMMVGGSTETLHIDIGINKVVKVEDVRQFGIGSAQPRLTWGVFTVARGTLVEDLGALPGAAELPTYGSTKVGLIVQEKYVCCGVRGNTTRLNTNTLYSNVPYGQSFANEGLLNAVDQGVLLSNAIVT